MCTPQVAERAPQPSALLASAWALWQAGDVSSSRALYVAAAEMGYEVRILTCV